MKFEGVFGLYHIIYLIISIILTVGGLIFIKYKIKDEKLLRLIIRIGGGILLAVIIANRISSTYYHINFIDPSSESHYDTWAHILPNSLCGLNSFIIAIICLAYKKKDNKVLHYAFYTTLFGTLLTAFYPDFLNSQVFSETASWTGCLHHSISLFLILLLLITKEFNPCIKKWFYIPIGYGIVILYGLLTISIFSRVDKTFTDSMHINSSLIKSLPVLTSWYMLAIWLTLLSILFICTYEKIVNKKDLKTILYDGLSIFSNKTNYRNN